MLDAWTVFPAALSAIFVVVDPLGAVPMYLGITRNQRPQRMPVIALKASIVGAGILVFFTLFGAAIFQSLHLNVNAFKTAGGVLLLLTALDMLRGQRSSCRCSDAEADEGLGRDEVAITPIAIPLLAGPGAITTVVVLMSQATAPWGALPILAAILLTFAITYLVLLAASRIHRLLGVSGILVLGRVMGLLLAALAIQFLTQGLGELLGPYFGV